MTDGFKSFLKEQAGKELKRASFQDHVDYLYGDKKSPPDVETLHFPGEKYLEHDKMHALNGGNPDKGPLGDSYSYHHGDAVLHMSYNKRLGNFQVFGKKKDLPAMKEFRKKMVHAYDKKHPGTIDKIKSSWEQVPGKSTY